MIRCTWYNRSNRRQFLSFVWTGYASEDLPRRSLKTCFPSVLDPNVLSLAFPNECGLEHMTRSNVDTREETNINSVRELMCSVLDTSRSKSDIPTGQLIIVEDSAQIQELIQACTCNIPYIMPDLSQRRVDVTLDCEFSCFVKCKLGVVHMNDTCKLGLRQIFRECSTFYIVRASVDNMRIHKDECSLQVAKDRARVPKR